MEAYRIPLGHFGELTIAFIVEHFQPLVDAFTILVEAIDGFFRGIFDALAPAAWIALVALIAWRLAGRGIAVFAIVGLGLIGNQGLWAATAETLSLVLTATLLSLAIAIPTGILMAESRAAEAVLDPFLDFLQTMPRFVYLIPAVVLLGIDVVPAVFATMTLAVPPPIRLTVVGIQQVDRHTIEAAQAFGASRWQTLAKVKLPLAFPTIMLGVNQCLMMSLSMAVIAALIGAGGLGAEVLNGIALLRAGEGVVAGLGIFVLAILIDRIMRGWADLLAKRQRPAAAARKG